MITVRISSTADAEVVSVDTDDTARIRRSKRRTIDVSNQAWSRAVSGVPSNKSDSESGDSLESIRESFDGWFPPMADATASAGVESIARTS